MKNKKLTLIEVGKEKTTVSARVNSYLVEQYKEKEIPVSVIIETSLVYFMKLDEREKIKFISSNLPENTTVDELNIPNQKWSDLIKNYLSKISIPSSIAGGLLSGVAVGAVALIGSFLKAVDDKNSDK